MTEQQKATRELILDREKELLETRILGLSERLQGVRRMLDNAEQERDKAYAVLREAGLFYKLCGECDGEGCEVCSHD